MILESRRLPSALSIPTGWKEYMAFLDMRVEGRRRVGVDYIAVLRSMVMPRSNRSLLLQPFPKRKNESQAPCRFHHERKGNKWSSSFSVICKRSKSLGRICPEFLCALFTSFSAARSQRFRRIILKTLKSTTVLFSFWWRNEKNTWSSWTWEYEQWETCWRRSIRRLQQLNFPFSETRLSRFHPTILKSKQINSILFISM